jgi:hypothetical protein
MPINILLRDDFHLFGILVGSAPVDEAFLILIRSATQKA